MPLAWLSQNNLNVGLRPKARDKASRLERVRKLPTKVEVRQVAKIPATFAVKLVTMLKTCPERADSGPNPTGKAEKQKNSFLSPDGLSKPVLTGTFNEKGRWFRGMTLHAVQLTDPGSSQAPRFCRSFL